ncbi:MAG: response regulator [Acidobacteria bacterium]|nr:response regulator [Acidobacteriota bacterium]
MPSPRWHAPARLIPPDRSLERILFGCGVSAVATLARWAVDPVIHDQIPYFIYVASVVVTTWFGGALAGITGTLLAALAGNYLFVPPRYEFVPSATDLLAMGMFSLVALGLVAVVSQWRVAETAARRRAEELRILLDTVPAAVFVAHDRDARRVEVNPSARRLLGLPTATADIQEDVPRHVRLVKDGRELPFEQLPLREAARGGHLADYEVDVVREDGEVRTLFGNATSLRDENGEVCGAVGAFVDVSERKRAEEALRHADRIKDDFLATLSHELRTPLNAIVGWASMLVEGRLAPEAVPRAYDSIARNAAAQRHLIEDVLDVSRIISGKLQLDSSHLDAGVPLRAAVDAVRPAAEARGIAIAVSEPPGPLFVNGDGARLQQVFWNLLVNAVKFSADGGRVEVGLRAAGESVEVQVRDHGIGISPEFLPHVFDRFRQLDSSATRKYGGLGLGLSIVQHLVELHGGTVTASSEGEGTGTTMVVGLPASPLGDRRRGDASRPASVPALSGPVDAQPLLGLRVLVVDDQPDAREMAALVLGHHGAEVATAASAAEALDQLSKGEAHVLVIDLAMPQVDGHSLIRTIRAAGGRLAETPAIALSAYARNEDRQRALAAGFQLHLAKPAEPRVLVRAVAALAADRRAPRGAVPKA